MDLLTRVLIVIRLHMAFNFMFDLFRAAIAHPKTWHFLLTGGSKNDQESNERLDFESAASIPFPLCYINISMERSNL